MDMKTAKWKVIGLLLILIFICLGLIIALISTDLNYLFSMVIAFLLLSFSVIMSTSQKRMTAYSVMALIIGLLFLASGIIDFGFRPFEMNMSISEKSKFYTVLRPQEISLALSLIGLGLLLVLLGFRQIMTAHLLKRNAQLYRMIFIAEISVGVSLFVSGIYQVINGLYPSIYQLYGFYDIGQKVGIICFGLLILWYLVAQPIIRRKQIKASFNDNRA